MEYPHAHFPGFHHEGPTAQESPGTLPNLGWGGYGRVQEDARYPGQRHFISKFTRAAERWETREPTPVPLLPPNTDCGFSPVTESDLLYRKRKKLENTNPRISSALLNCSQQVSRFCWDQSSTAFQSMGPLLEPHFYLGDKMLMGKHRIDKVKLTKLLQQLQNVPFHECPFPYSNYPIRALSFLTNDWLLDVPPVVLDSMVNDGMADEWKQLQFQESLTGGALSWVPYHGSSGGCLIYPRGPAMNQLHFQQMLVKRSKVKIQGEPAVCDLQQRVRQISTGEFDNTYVGVRSMYNLATWRFSADYPPRPLSVVRTKTPSTCVNVSPHLPGEFCVCTEGGALYLWNLERGLQTIRMNNETLFFRDDPRWRWSDFTSHPCVLLYADRTGVQSADIRVEGAQGMDLFHIGQESSSQKGERVILSRCLRETDPTHFLVTTQSSVYIMDERFPLVPLVKWTHMLQRPPAYVSVIPGGETERNNKILLGTQHSHETVMLQYSGGNMNPCQLHLPALGLPWSSESLQYLDPLLPHHRDIVTQRLASPMAGLAAAWPTNKPDLLTVFQLTDAGDIFTQRLVNSLAPSDRRSSTMEALDVTSNLDPVGQEPVNGINAESLDHSPETTANQNCPSTPIREVTTHEAPLRSLRSRSKLTFHKWIHDLLKICKGNKEALERPRFHFYKMFHELKSGETPQEVDKLRDCLRQGMRSGKLIRLDSSAESKVEPVRTDPHTCKDPLSQRLTAAWAGRLGSWWDDHLGLNKMSKMQALREKRRRHKLQRARSQGSVTGSLLSSHTFGSDVFDTDAGSVYSYDSAPMSDIDLSIHSGVSKPQGSVASAEQPSNWSFQSGPSGRSDFFNVKQTPTHSEPSSQKLSEANSLESCSITSMQSLRSKGIPKERRRTLQHFLNFLGESRDPPISAPPLSVVPTQSPETPSQSSQPQTPSQSSQPQTPSQNFQPQTPPRHSQPPSVTGETQTQLQLSQNSSFQSISQSFPTSSQRLVTHSQQSLNQRPTVKKFHMGF
ncbi:TATA box-binding protein-associated factor RNA polymerase I subunit C-like isoform X2 [Pyxicephalus adspersus]